MLLLSKNKYYDIEMIKIDHSELNKYLASWEFWYHDRYSIHNKRFNFKS